MRALSPPFSPLPHILPPPSPPLLGHVAAAPAEIIGAKAWGCYLHRNSMTPQAASGEGHRDHLSQNFNENFCWDRDFFPSTRTTLHPPRPPTSTRSHPTSFHSFANFYSSTVPSVASDAGALSSSLFSTGTVWSEIRWHISIVPLRTTGTSPLLAVCQTLQEAGKTGDVSVVTTVCGCFKLLKCPVKSTYSRHWNTQWEWICILNVHIAWVILKRKKMYKVI